MVIEFDAPDETTTGGIIIANAKNEGLTKGTVVAIGKGSYDSKGKFKPTTTPVGSKILFNAGSGEKFKFEDKEYIWLEEEEVIGILQ